MRWRVVILAAVISILFLLLVSFRPFASKSQQLVPSPSSPPVFPPTQQEPNHPSHADLLNLGIKEYNYEKVISHRITLSPAGEPNDDVEEDGVVGLEKAKLEKLAKKYGVSVEEFLMDFADLGREG